MKIKDLPPEKNMGGVKFVYPEDNETYIWVTQWNHGIWARKESDNNISKIYPLFFDDIQKVMDWEVVE